MKTYQLTIVRDAQDGSTDVTTTLTGEVNANAATEVAAVTQQLFEDLQDEPDATTGVSWHKEKNKWISQIYYNGRLKFLGYFKTEIEASNAYQNELLTISTKPLLYAGGGLLNKN